MTASARGATDRPGRDRQVCKTGEWPGGRSSSCTSVIEHQLNSANGGLPTGGHPIALKIGAAGLQLSVFWRRNSRTRKPNRVEKV